MFRIRLRHFTQRRLNPAKVEIPLNSFRFVFMCLRWIVSPNSARNEPLMRRERALRIGSAKPVLETLSTTLAVRVDIAVAEAMALGYQRLKDAEAACF